MQRCFCTVGFRIQIVVRVRRVFFLHFSAAESLGRREGRPASGGLAWAGRGEFCSRLDIVFHSSERGRLACLARYARERESIGFCCVVNVTFAKSASKNQMEYLKFLTLALLRIIVRTFYTISEFTNILSVHVCPFSYLVVLHFPPSIQGLLSHNLPS